MNLHAIRSLGARHAWFWLEAVGGNGQSIGTHLWELDRGDVPEMNDPPAWATRRNQWTPRRFHWKPFDYSRGDLGRHGWVRPLCGHRSTSRRPRFNFSFDGFRSCQDCSRIASERGIVDNIYRRFIQTDSQYVELRAELDAWRAS